MQYAKLIAPQVSDSDALAACTRCGACVRGGTEGCWKLYHEIVALEFSDPAYGRVHLLSVDAHALQHPEDHGVKNNPFHLASLCWMLEHNGDARTGATPRGLQKSFDTPRAPVVLDPPINRGEITVADVYGAPNADEHFERVRRWSESVWNAWSAHHAWAREWIGNTSY